MYWLVDRLVSFMGFFTVWGFVFLKVRDYFFPFKLRLWLLTYLQWGIKQGWLKLLPPPVVHPTLSSFSLNRRSFFRWAATPDSYQFTAYHKKGSWKLTLVSASTSFAVNCRGSRIHLSNNCCTESTCRSTAKSNNFLNHLSLGDCKSLSVSSNHLTLKVTSVKLSIIRKIIQLFKMVIVQLLCETVQSVQQWERLRKVKHWYYLQWA